MLSFIRSGKINRMHLLSLFCILSIIGFFAFNYLTQSHNGLPIGWDTPRYSAQTSSVLKNGLSTFIVQNDFYNFVYAILLSLLVLVGFTSLTVEIFVPIVMCIGLVLTSAIIVKKFLGKRDNVICTTLMALTWFTTYRLATDLHPNLLALIVLLYASLFFLFKIQGKIEGLKQFTFLPLLFVASFIHIETTLFFTFILMITILIIHLLVPEKFSIKSLFLNGGLLAIIIFPASVFYFRHMETLISYGSGNLVFHTPMSVTHWLTFVGISFPLSILGIYLVFRNFYCKRDFSTRFIFTVFIGSWVITSVAFAVSHYFYQTLFIFSERALMLFPVPFVAGFGLKSLIHKLDPKKLSNKLRGWGKGIARIVIVAIFLVSLFFTYLQVLPSFRVWLPASAYDRVKFLSENQSFETPPIFILNDYDQYSGDLGNLNNDYIGAIFGEHFTYLGRLDFLLAAQETPFVSLTSQVISAMFVDEMRNRNIFHPDDILTRKVIIISDFYLPKPLPNYYKVFFDEIYDGVFVLNSAKLAFRNSVYVPFYSSSIKTVGHWYPILRDWTESVYALELWDENPTNQSLCEVPIVITKQGTYKFNVRYETSNEIILEIDDDYLGQIRVNEQINRGNFTAYMDVTEGMHVLRLSVVNNNGLAHYASLDYIEYTLTY